MSNVRMSGDEFRLRLGGFSVSSLSDDFLRHISVILKGRSNQMYYNDMQSGLRSGKLVLRLKVL